MSIQSYVNELTSIKSELKSIRLRGTQLRIRAKKIEEHIKEYLDSKEQPGVKYKGTAIIREIKTKHNNKKIVDQKADCIKLLEKYGINNPEKLLEELHTAKKGHPVEQTKLTFKKYKD